MIKFALASIFLLALPTQTSADSASARDTLLVQLCVDQSRTTIARDDLACASYLRGISVGIALGWVASWDFGNAVGICIPDGVTIGQTETVITRYLIDHPHQWHLSSADIVGLSLMSAFPRQNNIDR